MRTSITLITAWAVASHLFNLNSVFIPDFLGLLRELKLLVLNGELLQHLVITFFRVIGGVVFAVAAGVPLGIVLGRVPLLRRELAPLIEFVRGIPTSMLFPLFIVLFGLGEISKLLIAFYLAAPIVVVNTMIGTLPRRSKQGREDYIWVHRDKISFQQRVSSIIWDASPNIIAGIKVSISLGLVVIIVTEMFFVASSGVGWAAFRAYETFQIDRMYVYIFVAGLVGVGMNAVFDRSSKYFLPEDEQII